MSRIEAKNTQCVNLFDYYAKTLGTEDLTITMLPVTTLGTFVGGRKVELKRDSRYVVEVFNPDQSEARIDVVATYGRHGFDPHEKLTRREVVFEILGIWEAMLEKISGFRATTGSLTKESLIAATEILLDTYNYKELMDTWVSPEGVEHQFSMEAFIELINSVQPIKKLTAGTSDVFGLGDWNFGQVEDGDLWAV